MIIAIICIGILFSMYLTWKFGFDAGWFVGRRQGFDIGIQYKLKAGSQALAKVFKDYEHTRLN